MRKNTVSTVSNKDLIKTVAAWTYVNKLCIHPVKTECVLFSTQQRIALESIFCRGSRVEGRGFHVEGEGTKSRVESNIFFFQNCFFLEKVIIDAINVIKTNKKNLKNKWRVNIF